jgi:N-acetyl-anhydromuramyl-L-alanine amidase AmpD
MNIILRSSPNKNARPAGVNPSLLIIHGTAGKSDAGDLSWLLAAKSKVSYHYLIARNGQIWQLVPDKERAWHAGVSSWNGRSNCNDYSIGIGLSNDGAEPFTDAQYESCKNLVEMLRTKHDIPLVRVLGHHHVSPGRKSDPWLHFHWLRIA